VNLLLDTNALLWLLLGDRRLGDTARRAIDGATTIALSETSLLEISIKVSIGRLPALDGLHDFLRTSGIQRTSIRDTYLARLETLPMLHRDPFDRLLIAQALTDDLTVVTADSAFAEYGVRVIDARA
jgi:PIN domain nuclease of toxin-antitoxin system